MDKVEEIAKGLTKAQRRWILAAKKIWSDVNGDLWATFPPSNTCKVLFHLKLWQWDGCLTPFGLAVRAHLMGEKGQSAPIHRKGE